MALSVLVGRNNDDIRGRRQTDNTAIVSREIEGWKEMKEMVVMSRLGRLMRRRRLTSRLIGARRGARGWTWSLMSMGERRGGGCCD